MKNLKKTAAIALMACAVCASAFAAKTKAADTENPNATTIINGQITTFEAGRIWIIQQPNGNRIRADLGKYGGRLWRLKDMEFTGSFIQDEKGMLFKMSHVKFEDPVIDERRTGFGDGSRQAISKKQDDRDVAFYYPDQVPTDNKTYKEKFFFNGTAVSMGNPHFIVFVKDVDALDLEDLGPQFEHHKLFPEGVNTEFAQIIDENTVKFRVWERGSGETLACGTGACAVTYACMKLKKAGAMNKPLNVQARGGLLKVTYSSENDHIYLQGPAVEVFTGEIEIPDCEL